MKILHTADWHLGCKTDDYDRLEEQKNALSQVVKIAKEKQVDMVIIAGDIYDSFVPSSDAEDLFYNTISDLNNNGNTIVVAISGNHDEPKRLSNANIFANRYGIYLLGTRDKVSINSNKEKNIYATKSGKCFIEFETKKGEKIVLAYLPYPSYYRFKEIRQEDDNFNEKVQSWFAPGFAAFRDDTINIATSHLMTYGVSLTAEEFEVYTTGNVKANNFVDNTVVTSAAHYTALGHIHKCIAVNKEKNIHYSGSLINMFFNSGETPTKVILADISINGVESVEKIPLDVKLLKSFTVSSIVQAEMICKDNIDDLLKISIENVDRVDISDIKRLRKNYPNLITLSVITKDAIATSFVVSKKNLTNAEIFDSFVENKIGKPTSSSVRELFLELMSEDLYETN